MIRSICTVSALLISGSASTTSALSTPYGQTTRNIATQILQGAGPATVDLNQYNLPQDQIEEQWTAQTVQKTTEKEPGVFLRPKDDRNNFVDVLQVVVPRLDGQGLGIELKELAGGRDDGLGITLVTGLVSGGAAEGSGILPGDSIAEVSIVRTKVETVSGLEETEQVFSVKTECLSYDMTVQAIQSLPSIEPGFEDYFRLAVKRLRRKPKVKVNLQYPTEQNEPDLQIEMFAGENLRQGMLVRGVKLNDPLAKRFDTKSGGNCGAGGLCRTCAVSIREGGDLLNPQRMAEKQMLQDSPRWRLACKAIVGFGMKEGEITVRVNPRQWQ
jgi:ferredoxin